ncbi:MAG: rhomboid family intramembrane serine protease [Gemmatimonadetes bacterium]|nr:rhomboid family intramembrane serine protease [Gemmatimonadota bacterium]
MTYGGFSFGYHLTPWVKRLLLANAAVFLLAWAVPALGFYLAFVPRLVLFRPWSFLSYMFVHADFWHLFFNLLGLFFFGPPLEERWGSREFLKYYLVCGLGGALLSFLFASGSSVVGASAAVFGVMLAFAMNWPDAPIYIWGIFPVKAKWLVGILAALALLSAVRGAADGVAHFAHLGGFAAGFLYLKLGDAATQRLARVKKLMRGPRLTVLPGAKEGREPPPRPRPRHRRDDDPLLDEVDRVLDKISTSGMASLTPDERKLLDDVSKRFRRD